MGKSVRTKVKLKAKQEKFLAAYQETGHLTKAAEFAGCHRNSHYMWWDSDPEYPEKFRQAELKAGKHLEEEARRRAQEGLKRVKFFHGVPIIDPETGEPYTEHEYSDTLLIFLLKGLYPDKYRERVGVSGQVSHDVSGKVEHEHTMRLVEDTGFWDNADTIAKRLGAGSDGIASPAPDSEKSVEVQSSGVREAVGENGNGTHRNGKGPRSKR